MNALAAPPEAPTLAPSAGAIMALYAAVLDGDDDATACAVEAIDFEMRERLLVALLEHSEHWLSEAAAREHLEHAGHKICDGGCEGRVFDE